MKLPEALYLPSCQTAVVLSTEEESLAGAAAARPMRSQSEVTIMLLIIQV